MHIYINILINITCFFFRLQISYDYYRLMGSNDAAVIAYVKTFFASVNAYFGLITQPRVQISIKAIDILRVRQLSSTL